MQEKLEKLFSLPNFYKIFHLPIYCFLSLNVKCKNAVVKQYECAKRIDYILRHVPFSKLCCVLKIYEL